MKNSKKTFAEKWSEFVINFGEIAKACSYAIHR